MGKYNCGDYMTGMDENYVYYLVSRNLKRIRKEKGLTQEKLAELSNYSVGFIMNIESEKYYQTFSLGTLWQFGKALNVDIREFFRPLD
ncbi:helix-turn-helix domain protein [Firmicutes bacterium CAG:582]|nr:helix-turn-helix domain protein [Firmicutes bacterium CAG:582]